MEVSKKILESVPFQYANDVLTGKITTGKYIKLAVERFFELIEGDNDYVLDNNEGMKVINFFPTFLKHTKGPTAGEPFTLSPYQQFTYYQIFAFKKYDENERLVRLFRTVFEMVARKNGKTAGLAGLGLYGQGFDGVEGPEIYVGATKENQAKVLWEQAMHFVKKGPALRQGGYRNLQREIRTEFNLGYFRFLGGDSNTQDGLNPSLSILDEYHAHRSDSIREVLESAMGARLNPLTYLITTAGTDVQSVCKAYYDVCLDILNGVKKDDSTLIMIHQMDEDDDWENPENWKKANPNLGVSVSMDYLKTEYLKAKNQPSKAPNFKTKHLNQWVDAYSTRIPNEIWMQNTDKPKIENFLKYGCSAGMDLSSRIDLSAFVLVSNPDPQGFVDILPFIFCPKDTVHERSKEDRVPYDYWQNVSLLDYLEVDKEELETKYSYLKTEKILTATPGNQIDYDYIKNTILKTFWLHGVKWVDFDRYKSTELVQTLEKMDVKFYEFSQTISMYSFPTQEFERLAFNGKIRHGGHPILQWCISNVMPFINNNEDIRYVKKEPKKRIDPVQAAIMALAACLTQEEETNESQYNDQDEIII